MTRDTKPAETLADFWARLPWRQRVHAVVALPGASQPVGTMAGWGVLLDYAEMVHARQPDPDKWHIVEMEPPA